MRRLQARTGYLPGSVRGKAAPATPPPPARARGRTLGAVRTRCPRGAVRPGYRSYAHVLSVSIRATASPMEIETTTSPASTAYASACVVSPLERWNTAR
jgi:hypothetical protein